MPGVKGMKWGVRRFQNEDGSLTSAGKKRYGSAKTTLEGSSKMLSDASRIGSGQKSKVKNTKDYSKMTDSELKEKVRRLNLEQDYARLTGDSRRVRSGSDWAREALQSSAIVVGMAASAVGIYLSLKNGKGGA